MKAHDEAETGRAGLLYLHSVGAAPRFLLFSVCQNFLQFQKTVMELWLTLRTFFVEA